MAVHPKNARQALCVSLDRKCKCLSSRFTREIHLVKYIHRTTFVYRFQTNCVYLAGCQSWWPCAFQTQVFDMLDLALILRVASEIYQKLKKFLLSRAKLAYGGRKTMLTFFFWWKGPQENYRKLGKPWNPCFILFLEVSKCDPASCWF